MPSRPGWTGTSCGTTSPGSCSALSGSVSPPAPDYISPIAIWEPTVVRPLMEHIADSTERRWLDAVAGELHVSEFVLYGVFVDHVLGGMPFDGPLCHNYYERTPLSPADGHAFADQMPSNALGAMISSHSRTPSRCAERFSGGVR